MGIETDPLGGITTNIGSGSTLLVADTTPLGSGETRTIGPLMTRNINTLGIDIKADQACTLQVVRLPDGSTPGEASSLASVAAGVPACHTYSQVMCRAVRIVVINTSGVAMTDFALHVRGGA